jgi:hypothetical protein
MAEDNVIQDQPTEQADAQETASGPTREDVDKLMSALRKEREERKKLEKALSELKRASSVGEQQQPQTQQVEEFEVLRRRVIELETEVMRRDTIDQIVSALERKNLTVDRSKLEDLAKKIAIDDKDSFRATIEDLAEVIAKPRQSTAAQSTLGQMTMNQKQQFVPQDVRTMSNGQLITALAEAKSQQEFNAYLNELRNRVDLSAVVSLPKVIVGANNNQ